MPAKRGWDTIGFLDGFEGLLEPLRYRPLDYKEMDALLFVGGTVLGTSNKGRFAAKTGHGKATASRTKSSTRPRPISRSSACAPWWSWAVTAR